MLRRPPNNLNKQSENATVLLIREVLDKGIELEEVNLFSSITLHPNIFINEGTASAGLHRRTGQYNNVPVLPFFAISDYPHYSGYPKGGLEV